NYNGLGVVEECLEAFRRACRLLTWELYVVDNASTDGSREIVARRYPWVHLIASPTNRGYAGGASLGLSACSGRRLVVSNHDVRVAEDALLVLLDAMEENPRVGLVGPAILDPTGRRLDPDVGSFPTLPSVLARRILENSGVERLCRRSRRYRGWFGEGRDPDRAGPVDQISGAFLCVRREALLEVGPMDERYFLFLEETDWCRRMWKAGWQVAVEPRASVRHLGSVSTGRLPDRDRIHDRSMARYLEKHRGLAEAVLFRIATAALVRPLSLPRRLYLAAKARWQATTN
ncbi:MAG: glycosyltransferase family 2 protein, partial [Planctomycetes bacterium]|nr:glycosyltransferase family 2 protein [Planctomycetota bacterium]